MQRQLPEVLVEREDQKVFGFGPIPALGIAGAGVAVVLTTALTAVVLAWYIGSGRSLVRLKLARMRQSLFIDILRVGAVGSVSTLQTSLTVALTSAVVSGFDIHGFWPLVKATIIVWIVNMIVEAIFDTKGSDDARPSRRRSAPDSSY